MIEPPPEKAAIRRIMVALDTSPQSVEALAAAVRLATALKAELRGVFVEDSDLLGLTALPFVREVQIISARVQALDIEHLSRELRGLAMRAQRLFEEQARAAGLSWSFTTVRGRVSNALMAAAEDADLVTVGCAGFRRPAGRKFGSTARVLAQRLQRPLLLMHRGDDIHAPVCVLRGISPAATRAMDTARRIGSALDAKTQVLPLSERARPDPTVLAASVRACGAGLVVAAADAAVLQGEGLQELFHGLRCPLLLVH